MFLCGNNIRRLVCRVVSLVHTCLKARLFLGVDDISGVFYMPLFLVSVWRYTCTRKIEEVLFLAAVNLVII